MIIVKLLGGPGNQMFQYALGRHLAILNNTELKLDITGFENQRFVEKREYFLNRLKIKESFATEQDIKKLSFSNVFMLGYLSRRFPVLGNLLKPGYISEKHFHYNPETLSSRGDLYLEGFWQSEKYFRSITEKIKSEFVPKIPLGRKSLSCLTLIKKSTSVAISTRRGEFAKSLRLKNYHGVLEGEYYFKAAEIVAKKVNNPRFFVFSDDLDWAKQHIRLKFPTVYVSQAGTKRFYEDIFLMAACKHNIIANSAFSWWGAWLNPNPDKIVVAPKQWLANPRINTADVIPREWLRL